MSSPSEQQNTNKDDRLKHVPYNDHLSKDERYDEHFALFQEFETNKNQIVRHLSKDGIERNILDYVLDSVDRMNERRLKPDWKEDYNSNLFDPITRGKVISILSIMAQSRMKAEPLMKRDSIFTPNDLDLRASIYRDLLDESCEHNMDDYQLVFEMFTALSEGTVIGYEGWMKGEVEYEYPKDFNPDTGEISTVKVKTNEWDDVYGELVPIEEFYPETIWVNAKDFYTKVKRVFRAREMTFDSFMSTFGKYPGAEYVKSGISYFSGEQMPYGVPTGMTPGNVFVLEFYDSQKKKKGLWANGKELYYGALPFAHGQLPFWISIGEPIHQGFLFGKSLPDKLMGPQDVSNGLLNGMLDQIFFSLNSSVFVDGLEDLVDGYLEPGRMYELAPGGKVERINLGQVDQTTFQMYSLLKSSMEEASISSQAQGVPSGGRKTKYEVQQLTEGSLQLAGLFLQLMEQAMKRKYWLRMYNILQYYSMPSRDKSGKKKFKFIEREDSKLTNGKRGKRRIQIVGSNAEVPPSAQLQSSVAKEMGQTEFDPAEALIEPIFISREWLLNKELSMEMRLVPNSSIKDSKVQRQNKDIAFFQSTANNPNFDQREVSKDFAKAFDKDIERVMAKEQLTAPGEIPGLQGVPGLKGQGGGQTPQIDTDIL